MKKRLRFGALAAALMAVVACQGFKDLTPENIIFQIRGEAGTEVNVIYSTQFVAGVDDVGTTDVQVFSSDTVRHVLPVDTVFNIAIDRQWFVLIETVNDTLDVDVIVDVDDRNLLAETGSIFPANPWIFVYMFNRALTRNIEVII